MNMLLVDHDPSAIQDIIAMFGYHVDVALDGLSGLQCLEQTGQPYDLMLLDLTNPAMDGWALLKAIRNGSHQPDIPIILLAASDDSGTLISGLRLGADALLKKPLLPGIFLAYAEALTRRVQWDRNAATEQGNPADQAASEQAMKLLTRRERELLSHLARGLPNSRIGQTLSISETTVKNHLAHIFKKLSVSNRTEAAYVAQKLNMV